MQHCYYINHENFQSGDSKKAFEFTKYAESAESLHEGHKWIQISFNSQKKLLNLHIDKLFSTSFMSNINSLFHQIFPQKDRPFEDFGLHSGLDWSGVQLRALSLPCHGEEDGSVSNGGGSIPRSQGSGTGNDYPSRYGSIWYFHKDHLGSSTLITDGTLVNFKEPAPALENVPLVP